MYWPQTCCWSHMTKKSDSSLKKEIGSSCKLLGSIISGCPFLPQAPSGFALAFGNLLYILAIFIFQKTCQSITRVGWKNWTTPLSLFREGIAVYHHPRPEWYHISCRLLCNTWQISDLSWFSSELMCSTFQRLLPLPVYPSFPCSN